MSSNSKTIQRGEVTIPTDASHKFLLKLDTIRIRVLDGFGEPHTKTKCNVEIPNFRQSDLSTDAKGWLEVRCPPRTEYVDLVMPGVDETKRRVLLQPGWKDDVGMKERLANLGFFKHEETEKNAESFRRAHDLDTAEEDLQKHLDQIEGDYKTVDDPLKHQTSTLDEQAHDLSDIGERT